MFLRISEKSTVFVRFIRFSICSIETHWIKNFGKIMKQKMAKRKSEAYVVLEVELV